MEKLDIEIYYAFCTLIENKSIVESIEALRNKFKEEEILSSLIWAISGRLLEFEKNIKVGDWILVVSRVKENTHPFILLYEKIKNGNHTWYE